MAAAAMISGGPARTFVSTLFSAVCTGAVGFGVVAGFTVFSNRADTFCFFVCTGEAVLRAPNGLPHSPDNNGVPSARTNTGEFFGKSFTLALEQLVGPM
jgi:hypothetical protein